MASENMLGYLIIGTIILIVVIVIVIDSRKKGNSRIDTTQNNCNNVTKQIEELNELRKAGAITKEDFEEKKKKLLDKI